MVHHIPIFTMLMIDEWILDMINDELYGARR